MGYFLTQLARLAETTIISVGAHLTTSISGIFFLGIPAMISIGAYGFVIPNEAGFGIFVSMLISFGVSLVASLLFVLLYFKLSKDGFTVFTLTSLLAVEAVIKSWDKVTGGVLGIAGVMRPENFSRLPSLVYLMLAVMVLVLLFEYVLLKTWIGRFLQGIREDEHLVSSLQVSVKKLGAFVIIVSGLLAAIQGILAVWRIQFLDASFGSVLILVQMLTIAIIAMKPKVRWLFASSVFIVFLPELLRFIDLPSGMIGYARNFMYSVILIGVLLYINKKHTGHKRFI